MDVAKIADVTFTSPDRVPDVLRNFNADGFDSLYPKYKGGQPKTFTLPERREIKKIAKSRPAEHGLPLSTWRTSRDPDYTVNKARVEHLYAIADGEVLPESGEPEVVFCLDLCGHRNYSEGLRCRLSLA